MHKICLTIFAKPHWSDNTFLFSKISILGLAMWHQGERKERKIHSIAFYILEELLPYLLPMCAFQHFFLKRCEWDEKIKLSENYKSFNFYEEIVASWKICILLKFLHWHRFDCQKNSWKNIRFIKIQSSCQIYNKYVKIYNFHLN